MMRNDFEWKIQKEKNAKMRKYKKKKCKNEKI
jgi:hypothetical protein